MIRALFAVSLLSLASGALAADPIYKDLNRTFEERAADLVSRMTLEEKVAQLQNDAAAIPRLDVPAYEWWNEALHGVARAGAATVFPQAIGLSATFDVPLMTQVATAISDEARAKYHEFVQPRAAQALPGPHLLVAQHQHFPRPSLGPGPGNLRRRSLPDLANGRGLREGDAG